MPVVTLYSGGRGLALQVAMRGVGVALSLQRVIPIERGAPLAVPRLVDEFVVLVLDSREGDCVEGTGHHLGHPQDAERGLFLAESHVLAYCRK